jgi:hypothetical protein
MAEPIGEEAGSDLIGLHNSNIYTRMEWMVKILRSYTVQHTVYVLFSCIRSQSTYRGYVLKKLVRNVYMNEYYPRSADGAIAVVIVASISPGSVVSLRMLFEIVSIDSKVVNYKKSKLQFPPCLCLPLIFLLLKLLSQQKAQLLWVHGLLWDLDVQRILQRPGKCSIVVLK